MIRICIVLCALALAGCVTPRYVSDFHVYTPSHKAVYRDAVMTAALPGIVRIVYYDQATGLMESVWVSGTFHIETETRTERR